MLYACPVAASEARQVGSRGVSRMKGHTAKSLVLGLANEIQLNVILSVLYLTSRSTSTSMKRSNQFLHANRFRVVGAFPRRPRRPPALITPRRHEPLPIRAPSNLRKGTLSESCFLLALFTLYNTDIRDTVVFMSDCRSRKSRRSTSRPTILTK